MEEPKLLRKQLGQELLKNLKAVPVDDKLNIRNEYTQRYKQYQAYQKELERLELLDENSASSSPEKRAQEKAAAEQHKRLLEVCAFLPPFDFDPKVVKAAGGFPAIRKKLKPQYEKMTLEERLNWVDLGTNLFLTPQMRLCLDTIVAVLDEKQLGQSFHPHIGGFSGCGKTTLLVLLVAINMPELRETYNHIPVLMATCPGTKSETALYHRLIQGFGKAHISNSAKPHVLLNRLIARKDECKTHTLIIDEVGFLVTDGQKNILQDILNVMDIRIIIAGEDPLTWLHSSAARYNRFKLGRYLQPYTKAELSLLLSFVELMLPFLFPSNLGLWSIKSTTSKQSTIPGPAQLLNAWTKGILKDVMMIVQKAAKNALKEGSPSLTAKHLEDAARILGFLK